MTIDAKGLWAAVQENSAKKAACKRHRFEARPVKLGEKQTCLECGGTMSLTDMGNYIAGYEAAGKNADDIWPGYRKPALASVSTVPRQERGATTDGAA